MRKALTITAVILLLFAVCGTASDNPGSIGNNTGVEGIRPATDENGKQGNINMDSPSEKTVDPDEDEDEFEVDFEEDGKC